MNHKTSALFSGSTDLGKRFALTAILFGALLLAGISVRTTGDSYQQAVQERPSEIQYRNAHRAPDADRDKAERPSEIIRLIGVQPGMKIGEVGAGTGYFTFFLSRAVGEGGLVYANEIKEEALAALEANARESETLKNIITVLAPEDDPRFPSRDLDMIVAYCSFHDIENRNVWLRNAVEYLKPSGTLAIIDGYWPEHGGLTLDRLREDGARVGFRLLLHKDFSFGERSHHVHLFSRDG